MIKSRGTPSRAPAFCRYTGHLYFISEEVVMMKKKNVKRVTSAFLSAVCRKFADERSKYDMWGSNARAAYEELYSKEKFISTLESHLRTLCSVQG